MLVKNVKDFFKAKHQTLIANGIEACPEDGKAMLLADAFGIIYYFLLKNLNSGFIDRLKLVI